MHWLARQLLRLGVVLFCVTLLTYLIVNILPGDVAIVILGSLATPQDIAGLRADLGLDRPMLVRYFDWLGSALASIGLTIPAVVIAAVWLDLPLVLGLSPKDIALLGITLLVSAITLGTGRTNLMQGAVHLVLFAAFLFLSLVP